MPRESVAKVKPASRGSRSPAKGKPVRASKSGKSAKKGTSRRSAREQAEEVRIAKQRQQVYELALDGHSGREIARQIGISHTTVQTRLDEALELAMLTEQSMGLSILRRREIHRQRLSLTLRPWLKLARRETVAEDGEDGHAIAVDAAKVVVALMDRLDRLDGLSNAEKHSVLLKHRPAEPADEEDRYGGADELFAGMMASMTRPAGTI